MQTKTFEIRDRATFIPVLAIKLSEDCNKDDRYLLRRAGLNSHGSYEVALFNLQQGIGFFDPFQWPGHPLVRTMPTAHDFIIKHFDELHTGDVIDVEFILGETKEVKISEKISVNELFGNSE